MFNNPVVGAFQLIRNAITSANYIPNVQGWAIFRDGRAEFASGLFRGPVVVIDPTTGAVLASIGADGSGAFTQLTTQELFVHGNDVGTLLTDMAKGVVGQYRTSSALPAPGLNSTFVNAVWTQFYYDITRWYRISISTHEMKNTASLADSDLILKVVFNQPGVTGGASNEQVYITRLTATAGQVQSLNLEFYMGLGGGRANGTSTITLQWSSADGVTWTQQDVTTPLYWTVEDVGLAVIPAGGQGAPSGQLTYTVHYVATASRSYDGNGTYIGATDGDNNIYCSTFADRAPLINERYEVLFNGSALRADLAGATVNFARLWLFCFKAEEAKGTVEFGVTADTSLETTLNDTNIVGQTWALDDAWPNPGWQFFDLLTVTGGVTTLSEFLTHAGNGIIAQQPFPHGLAATGFRGYGFDPTLRPYLEINYTGNAPGSGIGYGFSGYGTGVYGS